MAYLKTYQYFLLIGEIFGGDRETVKEFLLDKHNEYKGSNPRFAQLIRECILEIYSVIEFQDLDFKNNWLINNPEETFEEAPDCQDYKYDNGYFQRFFSLSEFHDLISGFNDFVSLCKEPKQIEEITESELSEGGQKTTQKMQILILNEMGLFENEKFKNATLEKQGKVLAALLNMYIDNAKGYLGNKFDKKGDSKKSPYNSQSKKRAREILSLIDFDLNL